MTDYTWMTDGNGAAIFAAGSQYFAVGGAGSTFLYKPQGKITPLAFDTVKGMTRWVIPRNNGDGFLAGDIICVAELWQQASDDTIMCAASIPFNHTTQAVMPKSPSYEHVVDMTPEQIAEVLELVPA